ncbi:hypothetical protein [Pseudonocardia cypriaca]|uniref:DUF3558 domain-containing protein n=1 Tax=Pseudonocardia cypriaca TaxID=882449 RepID=A0A543FTW3_9PSEU|nr:hypothetical protein [Pseudonocardia cypriaca]TQM37243.1 hypothetical protein FB388_4450 [Pseudonocardia cypriaca]
MRGAGGGRAARALLAAALALAIGACGTSEAEPTALPTFPTADGSGPAATAADDGRVIPVDCGRILAAPDLEAVMGLPLGSVAVRTTVGVPQPAVGRTERVSCRYTRAGDGGGRALLDINATAYRDPAAASAQWQVNVKAESGERRDMPLGSAPAVVFEKRGQAVLMVAHSTSNLTLVLPDQPLPGGKTRVDALVDLALRVLPAVSTDPSTAPPPPPLGEPVSQAGASR